MGKVVSPVFKAAITIFERDPLAGVGPSTTTKLGDARTKNTSVLGVSLEVCRTYVVSCFALGWIHGR